MRSSRFGNSCMTVYHWQYAVQFTTLISPLPSKNLPRISSMLEQTDLSRRIYEILCPRSSSAPEDSSCSVIKCYFSVVFWRFYPSQMYILSQILQQLFVNTLFIFCANNPWDGRWTPASQKGPCLFRRRVKSVWIPALLTRLPIVSSVQFRGQTNYTVKLSVSVRRANQLLEKILNWSIRLPLNY